MTHGERNTLREIIRILEVFRDRLTTPPGRIRNGVETYPEGSPLWRRCDCAIKALEKMLEPKTGTFR
jgi:hypothetical protein